MKKLIAPLMAAALTAAAFAAISVAKDDGSGQGNGQAAGPAPGGPPMAFRAELSDEDKQALEEFRSCMKDEGVDVPGPPPEPGTEGEDQDRTFEHRLKPPTEEERAKMDEAFKACEDKLPEGAQFGRGPCGPPPGGPPGEGAAAPGPPPTGNRDS